MEGSQKTLCFDASVKRFSLVFLCFRCQKVCAKKSMSEIRRLCAKHTFLSIPLYAVHKGTFEKKTIFGTPIYAVHKGTFEIQAFRVLGALFSPERMNFSGPKKGNGALK